MTQETIDKRMWTRAIEKTTYDFAIQHGITVNSIINDIPSELYMEFWKKIHKYFDKFKNEQ